MAQLLGMVRLAWSSTKALSTDDLLLFIITKIHGGVWHRFRVLALAASRNGRVKVDFY